MADKAVGKISVGSDRQRCSAAIPARVAHRLVRAAASALRRAAGVDHHPRHLLQAASRAVDDKAGAQFSLVRDHHRSRALSTRPRSDRDRGHERRQLHSRDCRHHPKRRPATSSAAGAPERYPGRRRTRVRNLDSGIDRHAGFRQEVSHANRRLHQNAAWHGRRAVHRGSGVLSLAIIFAAICLAYAVPLRAYIAQDLRSDHRRSTERRALHGHHRGDGEVRRERRDRRCLRAGLAVSASVSSWLECRAPASCRFSRWRSASCRSQSSSSRCRRSSRLSR